MASQQQLQQLSPFCIKWRLVTPIHAFPSSDMALVVNSLPSSIERRCDAIRRCNVPEYAYSKQSIQDYKLTKGLRDLLKEGPRWAQGPSWFQSYQDGVQQAVFFEMRTRWAFRRLLHRFRLRRIERIPAETIDPITFCPIETPITVYDMVLMRKFTFDAKPLVKHVTHCLFQQERMISSAKAPTNVITNRPFTFPQLFSITKQVIRAGINPGHLLDYQYHYYDILRWKTYKGQALLIAAIKEELYTPDSIDGQDLMIDFMMNQLQILNIQPIPEFETLLVKAVDMFPTHSIVQSLRDLCFRDYEAKILKMNIRTLVLNAVYRFYMRELQNGSLWRLVYR